MHAAKELLPRDVSHGSGPSLGDSVTCLNPANVETHRHVCAGLQVFDLKFRWAHSGIGMQLTFFFCICESLAPPLM
jgi:hypothetical protein